MYTESELKLADEMYLEYYDNGTLTKVLAKMFGVRRNNKFFLILAEGCSRYLNLHEPEKQNL